MATINGERAPCLFVSHGTGPFPVLDPEQEGFRQMLRNHSDKLDGVKGILLFSAHWETDQPHISAEDEPGIFYDYEDMRDILPKEAFEIQYPANGNATLAAEVAKHLGDCGFKPVLEERGLDHSVFVPMSYLRPKADIPIVQMSILRGKDEAESTELNIRLGQAVECFRDKGYAIIGSGGTFHDFDAVAKAFFQNQHVTADASSAFEKFLESAAAIPDPHERQKKLLGWRSLSTSYSAHLEGSSEHLMPFMVTAGAGGAHSGRKFDLYEYKGVPMSQYLW